MSKSDIEDLKAWCHWKRLEKDVSEDNLLFVRAIENVISQVGTWKAKYERALKTHRCDFYPCLACGKLRPEDDEESRNTCVDAYGDPCEFCGGGGTYKANIGELPCPKRTQDDKKETK